MKKRLKAFKNELIGLSFLLPNILGFCVFILVPLLTSFTLAFSNWDVQLHNMFKTHPLRWVGIENFRVLLEQPDFWQYLGNTLFLMMGIPFAIAGSLLAALLLSRDNDGTSLKKRGIAGAGVILVGACVVLMLSGLSVSGIWMLLAIMACGIMVSGMVGGSVVYRTLFYTPHFTAGVATFILWKKMYNPYSGPINKALYPVLNTVSDLVNALPPGVCIFLYILLGGLGALVVLWRLKTIILNYGEGELGTVTLLISAILILVPVALGTVWLKDFSLGLLSMLVVVVASVYCLVRYSRNTAPPSSGATYRLGENMMFSFGLMVVSFVLMGFAKVFYNLPEMASDGLKPPDWILDYHWAKPSLMAMALWAAIGSNNMILYLAGLKNIPRELYEAAEIDGANALQRFWNITWPQLAPFTFFIFVMSVIHGLQGGFEMARTMTQGGPAGATTTLSYFIYIEGFETGRLGFASAVAWALFALVFLMTIINVKFGNRYVND